MNGFVRARFGGLRKALLAATILGAPVTAFAADVLPTPAGAVKLSAVFATFLGKSADAVTVTPEGDHYAVALDGAKLFSPLASQGVTVEMAPAKINLTEQSDGAWHVVRDGYPSVTVHFKDGDFKLDLGGYKFDGIFDPAIAGFRSAQAGVDKANFELHNPEVDETGAIGAVHATQTGTAASGGGLSTTVHEDIGDISVTITPNKPNDSGVKPPPVSFKIASGTIDGQLDNLRSHQLLALWSFFAAHPSRPELAANEDAFKAQLRTVLPFADKLTESLALQGLTIDSPKGQIGLGKATISLAANGGLPSKGEHEVHVAFEGIAPPPNVVPPGFHDLTPTAFDLAFKYSGYDFPAVVDEAINDFHLAGDGPMISEADRAKIAAKMKGADPIVIEVLPSHIVAPQADLSLTGKFQLQGQRPVGALTVKAKNFDKTMAAIKGAGPLATPQVIGGLALLKGLAKNDPDGSLVWVAEYGADGALKVNGLPLGKAPAPPK